MCDHVAERVSYGLYGGCLCFTSRLCGNGTWVQCPACLRDVPPSAALVVTSAHSSSRGLELTTSVKVSSKSIISKSIRMRSMSFQDLFSPPAVPKSSLGFILGDGEPRIKLEPLQGDDELRPSTAPSSTAAVAPPASATESASPKAEEPKRKKKRKARICKEPGCDKYVVDHGLCIRHGVSYR